MSEIHTFGQLLDKIAELQKKSEQDGAQAFYDALGKLEDSVLTYMQVDDDENVMPETELLEKWKAEHFLFELTDIRTKNWVFVNESKELGTTVVSKGLSRN